MMWDIQKYTIPIIAPAEMYQHEQDIFRLYVIGKLDMIFWHNKNFMPTKEEWTEHCQKIIKQCHAEFMSLLEFRKTKILKDVNKFINCFIENNNLILEELKKINKRE